MRKLRDTPDPAIEGMEYADPEVRRTFGARLGGDLIPPASVMRVPVVSGVLLHAGYLLLQQREPDRAHGFAWETPGGKIEPRVDSSVGDALRREWREELDLGISVGDWIAAWRFDPPVVLQACAVAFYSVRVTEDAYRPRLLEAIGVGWFTRSQAVRLPLTPGTAALLNDEALCTRIGLKP